MVPNICPDDTDPETLQAVEESLRVKFQRSTMMARPNLHASPQIGFKRQRNPCSDVEREEPRQTVAHDLATEQLLLHQQVLTTQHLLSQPESLHDRSRQHEELTHHLHAQPSQQQLAENSQHQLMTQQHLLRSVTPPLNDNRTGDDTQQHQQQQQALFAFHGFRTRSQQQQQMLSQQFSSPVSLVPAPRPQQQVVDANSQMSSASAELK